MTTFAKHLTAFAALFALLLAADATKPEVQEFMHLADTHVMDLNGVHLQVAAAREHYHHTADALTGFLKRIHREHDPGFAIISGDLIDAYSFLGANGAPVYGQLDRFAQIYRRSPVPLFLALGNHDILHYGARSTGTGTVPDQTSAGEARAGWIRAIDCFRHGTYYSFERRIGSTLYAFLVLDNGYYGGALAGESPGKTRQYRLAHEQLYWLKKQAERYRNDVMILILHVPLSDDPMGQLIESAIADRENVALSFTGHTHDANKIEELPFHDQPAFYQVRTPGFCRSDKHWRLVRLFENRIEISPTGRPEESAEVIALPVAAATR